MGATGTARNIPLGLPYEGMDLQTPLSALPMTRAPFIENFFLDGQTLKVRNGSAEYSKLTGAVAADTNFALGVYTASNGTQTLYALRGLIGNYTVCNYTANPGVSVVTTTCGPSSIFIQFRNFFYLMDGKGTPKAFDGTDWANFGAAFATSGLTAGFTGPSSVLAFKSGCAYRNRLYLIEDLSGRVWYGGTDLISGAMTSFDCSSLLTKGGQLHNVCTVNYGQNNAAASYICFVSDQGEALVYQGSYPGSTNFEMVARFEIGKPLSTRGYLNYQGDTLVCTETGLVSLRDMISYALSANNQVYKTYSNPIDPMWRAFVQANIAAGYTTLQNITSIAYLKRTGCIYVLFKYAPSRTNNKLDTLAAVSPTIFVYNTITGGWSYYKYVANVSFSIVEFANKLVMGVQGYGRIIELEKEGCYQDTLSDLAGATYSIPGQILTACLSAGRDAGSRQKLNALELFSYLNTGSTTGLECWLVENFGKQTGTTKPAYIEDDFNSIAFNVGSSREYVQACLTVTTTGVTGDPTVLYNLNALVESGGYR